MKKSGLEIMFAKAVIGLEIGAVTGYLIAPLVDINPIDYAALVGTYFATLGVMDDFLNYEEPVDKDYYKGY